MGMVVRSNIMAMNANRQLGINNSKVSKSIEKLSSGFKINRAGDDASGLAISEKMKAQIKGLDTASANSQDGISLIQTAEGALTEVHDMLNRMVELAGKSANGTMDQNVDRASLQKEMDALKNEIDRVAQSTNFNGINLLDGSLSGGGTMGTKGAQFTGNVIAKSKAAQLTGGAINDDLSVIDTNKAAKDIMSIDGNKITIDWTADENKGLAGMLDVDQTNITADQGKDLASKLQDVINNASKDQGYNSSVTVKYDAGTKGFTIKSDNKAANSEVSFLGSTNAAGVGVAVADAASSVMNNLTSGITAAADEVLTSVNKAALTYNGQGITAGKNFQMEINGVKVGVVAPATANGATMASVATALQTAIQTSVGLYNTAVDSTNNTDMALTATDFTVKVGDDGNLVVNYGGDVKDVSFSFSDTGENTTAADLGLATGSSLNGGAGGLTLQIGDTADSFNKVTVSVGDMSTLGLGISSLSVADQTSASKAQDLLKNKAGGGAINHVSATRADLGALQNRLEHTINNLDVASENMNSANSRIRDTDMAKEMMEYTKMNVLTQAAQAMLAQANQQPQSVLQLLQ